MEEKEETQQINNEVVYMISPNQIKQYATKFTPSIKQMLKDTNKPISQRLANVYNTISMELFKKPVTELDSVTKIAVVRAIVKLIFIRIPSFTFDTFKFTREKLAKPFAFGFKNLYVQY